MSENLKRIQDLARELARSGKFLGWSSITFELQFEPGFTDAFQWLYLPSTKRELDDLCIKASKRPTPWDVRIKAALSGQLLN